MNSRFLRCSARFPRNLVFATLLAACAPARADIEIIPLHFRTAEQVLPILQPLVEPGGALSGAQNQIIVRASASNIAQLRKVIASIDRQQRRLVISVRQDIVSGESGAGAGLSGAARYGGVTSGSLGTGSADASHAGNAGINERITRSRVLRDDRIDQQVQVVEGGTAVLQIGESLPVPAQTIGRGPGGVIISQSTTFRESSSGFAVVPRLAGDRVFLDIAPRREVPGPGGAATFQRMSTSASGRLGEWFELGAMESNRSVQTNGLLSSGEAQGSSLRRIWVKVEELQ